MKKNILILSIAILFYFVSSAQKSQQYLIKMAKNKVEAKEWAEALNFINEAIQKDATEPNHYVIRSIAKSGLNNYKGALKDLDKAIKLDPNYSLAYYNKGVIYSDYKNNIKKAIKEFSKAIEILPTYEDALINRGKCRYQIADYEGYLDDFNSLIVLQPENALLYMERSRAYFKLQLYAEAIYDNKKAISLEPENPNFHEAMGLVYIWIKENENACHHFQQAIDLNSGNTIKLFERYCK